MRTDPIPAARHTWRTLALVVLILAGAFSTAGVAQPSAAHATTRVVDQCNSHGPGAEGATTKLSCTVTVVNTISGRSTSSTTTMTRLCLLGPCATPNGTSTTQSTSLVTSVRQCNTSDNDAAHTIDCTVNILNNISSGTAGASPLVPPTVNQCVGSAGGGIAVAGCRPSQVSSASAVVTQCNGSANGGGGTVRCTVDASSRVSGAIPVAVNQCNGTGNPGGSAVTCRTSLITRLTGPAATTPAARPTTTPTTAARTTAPAKTTTATKTTQDASLVALASDSPQDEAGSTSPKGAGLLMVGAALVLVASIAALLFRRFAPADWRYARRH